MIGEGKYPESICEELLGYCLAPVCQMGGLGGDNMSIIIICFLHGKPYENLVEKCKKIHNEKKATTKLNDPAFTGFDRFTADGPFADLSVLKAADDIHCAADSSSSSSSPISTDEKFDNLLAESSESTDKTQGSSAEKSEPQKNDQPTAVPSDSKNSSDTSSAESKIENVEAASTESTATASDSAAASDSTVSNGE